MTDHVMCLDFCRGRGRSKLVRRAAERVSGSYGSAHGVHAELGLDGGPAQVAVAEPDRRSVDGHLRKDHIDRR